jgi:hypothetical protein
MCEPLKCEWCDSTEEELESARFQYVMNVSVLSSMVNKRYGVDYKGEILCHGRELKIPEVHP